MKFVGGPMHGLSVPDELERQFAGGIEYVRPVIINPPVPAPTGWLSLASSYSLTYVKVPWYCGYGPLRYFFAMRGMDPEAIIEQAREVMRC